MAQEQALINNSYTDRVRVRTPGKYIVACLFVPVMLIAAISGIWLNHRQEQKNLAALEYRSMQHGDTIAYYSLPEFLVDLSEDRDGRKAFLRLSANVVISDGKTKIIAKELAGKEPLIMERMTFFLRLMRPEDFEGGDAMERLKAELKKRINLVIAPLEVESVVIEEILIQ